MPPQRSTFETDALIRKIARPQLGLVTVAQAAAAGVDRFALARRRDAGALVPMFAGVMRLDAVASTPEQRILAASLAVPGSTIAATSAALVYDMPLPMQIASNPVVTVPVGRSPRTAGVTAIRFATPLPSRPWMNVRLATPSASVLLLPRFVGPDVVERCLDHCLAHRLATVASVRDLIERVPSRAVHGRALLLDLLAQRSAGIGHRSGLEQRVGRWLRHAGVRGWTRNFAVAVGSDVTVEVDFAWPSQKVALEVSPFITHGSRAQQQRDADRRRLLVACGWRITEATDPDLEHRRAFNPTVATLLALLNDDADRAFFRAV